MKGSVLPLWGFSFCLLCSVALAAKKAPVGQLSVGTATSSESAACLELFRFTPSVDQNRACLLYTSPSPRDRQKSRMPSSA